MALDYEKERKKLIAKHTASVRKWNKENPDKRISGVMPENYKPKAYKPSVTQSDFKKTQQKKLQTSNQNTESNASKKGRRYKGVNASSQKYSSRDDHYGRRQANTFRSSRTGGKNRAGNIVKGTAKQIGGQYLNAVATMSGNVSSGRARREALKAGTVSNRNYGGKNRNFSSGSQADKDRFARQTKELQKYSAQGRKQAQSAADKLTLSGQKDLDKAKEGLGKSGRFAVDLASQLGMWGADAAIGATTGGGILAPMFVRSFGGASQTARQSGANRGQQIITGLASGSVEAATEKLFSPYKIFKKTAGAGVADNMVERFAFNAADKLTKSGMPKNTLYKAMRNVSKAGLGMIEEGSEEVIADLAQPLYERIYDKDALDQYRTTDYWKNVAKDFGTGAAMAGVLGGSSAAVNRIKTSGRSNESYTEVEKSQAIQAAKAQGENTQAFKYASELETQQKEGKEILDAQIDDLTEKTVREIVDTEKRILTTQRAKEQAQLDANQEVAGETDAYIGDRMTTVEANAVNEIVSLRVTSNAGRITDNLVNVFHVDPETAATQAESIARIKTGTATAQDISVASVSNIPARMTIQRELGIKLPATNAETIKTLTEYAGMTRAVQKKNILKEAKQSARAQVFETLTQGMDDVTADIFGDGLENIKNLADAPKYMEAFATYYEGGRVNYDYEKIPLSKELGRFIPEEIRQAAFNAGNQVYLQEQEQVKSDQAKIVKSKRRKGTLALSEKNAKKLGKENANALRNIVEVTGKNVVVLNSIDAGSRKDVANGKYQNGVIYISAKSSSPVFDVLKHELTHNLQETAPEAYNELKQFVFRKLYDSDSAKYDRMVRGMIDRYAAGGVKLTRQQAEDELLADATDVFFRDYDMIEALANENRSLGEKLLDGIRSLLDTLHRMAKRSEENFEGSPKGEWLEALNIVEEAQRLWVKALNESVGAETGKEGEKYQIKQFDFTKEQALENMKTVSEMEPVDTLTGNEFLKGETDLIKQVEDYFNEIGNTATNEILGDVALNRKGIKSSIGHGIGRMKAIAFRSVPDVIERGKIIDAQRNWKSRGYNTVVMAAPIEVGKEPYYVAAVIERNLGAESQRYYLHEVSVIKKNSAPFKTAASYRGSDRGGNTAPVFSLLQQLNNVNSLTTNGIGTDEGKFQLKSNKDSDGNALTDKQMNYFKDSNAVDENGNLMLLYHQTGNDFTVFDIMHEGAGTRDNGTPYGIFMKPDFRDIGLSGKKQMTLYANIKNPLIAKNREDFEQKLRENPEFLDINEEHKRLDLEYKQKHEDAKKAFIEYLAEYRKAHPNENRSEIYKDDKFNELWEAEDDIVDEWTAKADELSSRSKSIITEYLKNSGYDGVILEEDKGSFGRTTKAYIALYPHQVKSVNNAEPTTNKDIRYQLKPEELKEWQFDIISNHNAAEDDYHTWVRSVDDIMTFQEAYEDDEYADYDDFMPDYNRQMAKAALESGKITVYSSHPIEPGIFVTPSEMEAQSYAGKGQVHRKVVPIDDIAWIEITQGQYTPVNNRDIHFQLKGDNERLQKKVSSLEQLTRQLKAEFKRSKYAKPNPSDTGKAVNKLIEHYLGKRDAVLHASIMQDIEQLYAEMRKTEGNWNLVDDLCRNVAEKITDKMDILHDELWQQYYDLRMHLRNTTLKLDEAHWNDITDFEDLRKAHFGTVKISKKSGVSIDTFYQELAEEYPELFDAAEYTNEVDQLYNIIDTVEGMRPYTENYEEGEIAEFTEEIAKGVLKMGYDLSQKKTFADIKFEEKEAAVAKVRAERNAMLRKQRERMQNRLDKKDELYKQKIKDVREKYRDNKDRKYYTSRIEAYSEWLSDSLLRPTDTKHLPDGYAKAVATMLESFDFSTKRSDKHTEKHGPSKRTMRFMELRNIYDKFSVESEEIQIDEEIKTLLVQLSTALDGKRFADLDTDQLRDVYHLVKSIRFSISTINRTFSEGLKDKVSAYGDKVIQESKPYHKKGAGGMLPAGLDFLTSNTTPWDAFSLMGDTMTKLFGNMRSGFDQHILNTKTAMDFSKNLTKKYNAKKWIDDNARPKKFVVGNDTIELIPSQVMSLYCLMKREQAVNHIIAGSGIVASPVKTIYKPAQKLTKGLYQKKLDQTHVMPTIDEVNMIIDSLTAEQKAVADELQKFMGETCADWGNETSLKLYGYKKFTEENYFPIKSSDAFLAESFDSRANPAKIKNVGFTKNVVMNASNPIVLDDIFSVFTQHVNTMSMYNALVPAITDFERVFNYKLKDSNGKQHTSVQKALRTAFGDNAVNYIKTFMNDLNQNYSRNQDHQIANKLMANYKKAKIGANLRVLFQQPTSYTRASAVMDWRYMIAAIPSTHTIPGLAKKARLEMQEHCPIALWKSLGFYNIDVSRDMRDIFLDKKNIVDTMFMDIYGKADDFTWSIIWRAVKKEINATRKELQAGSDEYWQAVSDRFSYVVDRTQVVDSVFHRSQMMRKDDLFSKMTTSFMAEPTKTFNLLKTEAILARREWKEGKKSDASKRMTRVLSTYLITAASTAAAAAVIDALRGAGDDDDDKTLYERWISYSGKNFVDNANPINMLPGLRDIYSLAQGYDVGRMDMAGFTDLVNSFKYWQSESSTKYFALKKTIAAISSLTGIPAGSVQRDIESMVEHFAKLFVPDEKVELFMTKLRYDISSSRNRSKYAALYARTYDRENISGANYIAQEVVAAGTDEKKFNQSVRTQRENLAATKGAKLILKGKKTEAQKVVRAYCSKYELEFEKVWAEAVAEAEENKKLYQKAYDATIAQLIGK